MPLSKTRKGIMLSVVILDTGEPKVIQLTYENLYNELRYLPGSEIIVTPDWFSVLPKIKNPFVCFVEADCLVEKGYFNALLDVFEKHKMYRTLAMVSSATGVCKWDNKIYGYALGNEWVESVLPVRSKVSKNPYEVPIAYFPGSIVRTKTLKKILDWHPIDASWQNDLVYMSTEISTALWGGKVGKGSPHNQGNSIYINPNTTYVTTEDYVGMIAKFTGAV